MTTELLSRLSGEEVESVRDRIRAAHAELPEARCMAWRHQMANLGKEGGCDIHPVEED